MNEEVNGKTNGDMENGDDHNTVDSVGISTQFSI